MTQLGLTAVEQKALAKIKEHRAASGLSPSFAELAVLLGCNSKGNVARVIVQLESKGYVIREPGRPRSLMPVEEPHRCPNCGYDLEMSPKRTEGTEK